MVSIIDRAVRILLRTGTIQTVEDLGPSFRRIELATNVPASAWTPGAKVQFHIRGTAFRTFTPYGGTDGSVSFLVHRHGGGGLVEAWLARVEVGAEVQLFGPRGSLSVGDLPAPAVVVGDETSIALATTTTPTPAALILEATSAAETETVARHLGLEPTTVIERQPDDGHHGEVVAAVLDALAAAPDAPLVLTGKADTIKAVRAAIKDAGLSPVARVKTYWDPRRSGLD